MPDEGEEGASEAPKTTTSGAQAIFESNAWLTAAAVAVYTTKTLWVKLRDMGLNKKKAKKAKGKKNAEQEELQAELSEPQPLEHVQTQAVSTCPI